ncbi:unnamed protein product [Brassica oleracea]
MVSMLGVRRINQSLCILSVISGIDDDTFDGDLSHFLGATTKDSQDRIRSFWTRKKDLQDEVVKNNLWSFEVSNGGTTRKDWKFKEDLCHAFIALKGLRSEPIAYREFECGGWSFGISFDLLIP